MTFLFIDKMIGANVENLVERWFAELTNKAVRRGSFANVPDLVAAIAELCGFNSLAFVSRTFKQVTG
jgi:AraC-like DNA-binding protein